MKDKLRGMYLQGSLCQICHPLLTAGVMNSLQHKRYLQCTHTEQTEQLTTGCADTCIGPTAVVTAMQLARQRGSAWVVRHTSLVLATTLLRPAREGGGRHQGGR